MNTYRKRSPTRIRTHFSSSEMIHRPDMYLPHVKQIYIAGIATRVSSGESLDRTIKLY